MDGMDTNKDMHGQQGTCAMCGYGMGGMYGRRHMGHLIFKILVALFIFWCGVQFGELKGILRSGYGYGVMSPNGTFMPVPGGAAGAFFR